VNADFPPNEVAIAGAIAQEIKAQSWRSLIVTGYLPFWSWRSWRFEWFPSDPLLDEWINEGSIG